MNFDDLFSDVIEKITSMNGEYSLELVITKKNENEYEINSYRDITGIREQINIEIRNNRNEAEVLSKAPSTIKLHNKKVHLPGGLLKFLGDEKKEDKDIPSKPSRNNLLI